MNPALPSSLFAKWQSPSNIAIIKYWGKKDDQIPINPSLSFTLSKSFTETEIMCTIKQNLNPISADFNFEGTQNKVFQERMIKYFSKIKSDLSIFDRYHLSIKSKNTFPHSTGIASSASAMSALAFCLLSIERQYKNLAEINFFETVSKLARLGSGSASRSVYPNFSLWGRTDDVSQSSDEYAISYPKKVHPIFKNLQDAILIVKSDQKKVSSSSGHKLMDVHPYKMARIKQANAHMTQVLKAIETGDFALFTEICEAEALSLHALMMTSNPSYILMEPESLAIIKKIKEFRNKTKLNLCFTLDAGPNIHLIYANSHKQEIVNFINKELLVFCESQKWIEDEMGSGPKQLN